MVPVGSVIATQTQAAPQVPFSHKFRKFKAIPSSNASNDLIQTLPHQIGHQSKELRLSYFTES